MALSPNLKPGGRGGELIYCLSQSKSSRLFKLPSEFELGSQATSFTLTDWLRERSVGASGLRRVSDPICYLGDGN